MENLKTFESFNDPNQKTVEKIQLSSYITKSDFFSMKKKNEKDAIKKLIAVGEVLPDKYKKDSEGNYVIETGNPDVKELTIPKKFIYEIFKK